MGLDNKLAHLSKAQIENLIERYYNGEKVKSLIDGIQNLYQFKSVS